MPAPTFPGPRIAPWQKEVFVAVETTPGTAAIGANLYGPILHELCRQVNLPPVRDLDQSTGYMNVASTSFDSIEMQHRTEGSLQFEFRNAGVGGLALALIAGSTSDTVTASVNPWTHTIVPPAMSTACNTITVWDNEGDSANVKQMTFGTLSSVHLSASPQSGLLCDLNLTGWHPTYVNRTAITPITYVGSTANYTKVRQQGNQAVYTFISPSGTAFTANILSMDLTISRTLGIVPNPNGKNPLDIPPGVLMVQGSFTFYYEGAAANTVYRAFSDYSELGSSGAPHTMTFTDAAANTLALNIFPIRLSDVQLNDGDTWVSGTASFITYNDIATANQATPALSMLKSAVLKNAISTPFVQ